MKLDVKVNVHVHVCTCKCTCMCTYCTDQPQGLKRLCLSKQRDIEQRYTNDAERIEARIREYKSSHPSPSWFQIMSQLQAIGAIAAAEAASDYVKG